MTIEHTVEDIFHRELIGAPVEVIYGESKNGRRFAIIITTVIWYAVRLVLDGYRSSPPWVALTQHLTLNGALEQANKFKRLMKNGNYDNMY